MDKSTADILKEQLADFHGAKLADVIVDNSDDDDDGYLGLVFQRSDGQRWIGWVLCDPEGNGPGFLDLSHVNNGHKPSGLHAFMAGEIGKEIGENFDLDELVGGAIADETRSWLQLSENETRTEYIERFGQEAYDEAKAGSNG